MSNQGIKKIQEKRKKKLSSMVAGVSGRTLARTLSGRFVSPSGLLKHPKPGKVYTFMPTEKPAYKRPEAFVRKAEEAIQLLKFSPIPDEFLN